jgi:hypothetical protein
VVRSEAVFRVTDRRSLHEAAAESVAAREYSGTPEGRGERDADLATAESDAAGAVLSLADPALMINDGCGVEPVADTCHAAPCDEHGRPLLRLPDFATLFPVCDCGQRGCDRCHGFQLTARTAALLCVSAYALADAGYDDVEEHGDDPVTGVGEWALFDQFPPITFRQNAVWRRQAARACDDLANDLAGGRLPEPRCPAEEMTLRLMISSAEAMLHDDHEFVAELVARLPSHSEDYDWPAAFESLLQDDDLAALFSADRDGIEDPDTESNRSIGMGDYRPPAWFDWFGTADPRDGRRPFRR